MTTDILTLKFNLDKASLRFEKIKTIKWLLNLEKSEQEFTFEDLQKQVDEVCYESFEHLVILQHYLLQMTAEIKSCVYKIIQAKNNEKNYKKHYFEYLDNFNKVTEFKEYKEYIYMHRSISATIDIQNKKEHDCKSDFLTVEKIALEYKLKELLLIYNIVNNDSFIPFVCADIMQNIPLLVYWKMENKNKPIAGLTNDECEILAAHIYHLSYDEMFEKLNFSSFVKTYQDINNIIKSLPAKFNVSNMTQVMFKLLLLKPYFWAQTSHEDIVESIKGASNG